MGQAAQRNPELQSPANCRLGKKAFQYGNPFWTNMALAGEMFYDFI